MSHRSVAILIALTMGSLVACSGGDSAPQSVGTTQAAVTGDEQDDDDIAGPAVTLSSFNVETGTSASSTHCSKGDSP